MNTKIITDNNSKWTENQERLSSKQLIMNKKVLSWGKSFGAMWLRMAEDLAIYTHG